MEEIHEHAGAPILDGVEGGDGVIINSADELLEGRRGEAPRGQRGQLRRPSRGGPRAVEGLGGWMKIELLVIVTSCPSCPPSSILSSAHVGLAASKVMHHNMASSSWSSSGSNMGVEKSCS